MRISRSLAPGAALALLTVLPGASEAQASAASAAFAVNNIWMLIASALVFVMHLGFATLETGLTQAKNTANIVFKNTSVIAIGLLTYAIVGFSLMYPGEFSIGRVFGFAGFGIGTDAAGLTPAYDPGYTYWTRFIFQAMFAATAVTIVSGAVAERIKLSAFLAFATLYAAFVYPWVGSWSWGGGWLARLGFHDFAGSTLVHSVGGWGALAGVVLLGPRMGKYVNGTIRPILGHNVPLAAVGMFLLWFGWYGFNGGSVQSADPALVSLVFVTTSLAASAGVLGAMLTSWAVTRRPDVSMVLNGALAGLVGITAGADVVTPMASAIIGGVAGIIVVLAVMGFDRARLDDPVGATSVHLVCGIWGTLAVGIFSARFGLLTQLLGVAAYGAVSFALAMAIFLVLRATIGLRVSEAEERRGLDLSEHNMEAYPDYTIFTAR